MLEHPLRRLTASLWIAGVLLLLRDAVVVAMAVELRGQTFELALWRLSGFQLSTAARALLAGLVLVVVTGLARRLPAAWLRWGLATLVATPVLYVVLSGWPFDDPSFSPGAGTSRGRLGILVISAGALGLAALLSLALVRGRREPRAAGAGALVTAGLFFLLAAVSVGVVSSARPPAHEVRRVVRDLLLEEPSWTVVEQHRDHAPERLVVAKDPRLTSHRGIKPSLILPPPGELVFEVRPEDGDVRLWATAGVDRRFLKRKNKLQGLQLLFEVQVNERVAFARELDIEDEQAVASWFDASGPDGLPLRPGDRVTLRTSVSGLREGRLPPRIPMAFGVLELEERRDHPLRRSSAAEPNIVLIVMDTLRADHLSCYGEGRATTPHLDALAERGLRFENAYATSSWTWPSTASILTGLWPESHGVTSKDSCYLREEVETLTELLAGRDFVTAAFSCNPIVVPDTNLDQGAARFDHVPTQFRRSSVVLPSIRRWLEVHRGARFFLYLHLVDSHAPYELLPPALAAIGSEEPADYPQPNGIAAYQKLLLKGEGLEVPPDHQRWMKDAYLASVLTADLYVGRLTEALRELGLEDETVVVFTSDHGEELLDHGLATHGQSIYEELVRVPLILAGPGIPPGRTDATPISNRHVAPTLARVGGGAFSRPQSPMDLLALSELEARPLFFSTQTGLWNGAHPVSIHGVRAGRWVLHYAPQTAGEEGAPEVRLYDLESDPRQLVDRSADEPERTEELRIQLLEHLRLAGEARSGGAIGAGESTLDLLKQIGYIED